MCCSYLSTRLQTRKCRTLISMHRMYGNIWCVSTSVTRAVVPAVTQLSVFKRDWQYVAVLKHACAANVHHCFCLDTQPAQQNTMQSLSSGRDQPPPFCAKLHLHCPSEIAKTAVVQLNFSDCVSLTPSDSSLQDKRAYHKLVLGERQLKNSTPTKKSQ